MTAKTESESPDVARGPTMAQGDNRVSTSHLMTISDIVKREVRDRPANEDAIRGITSSPATKFLHECRVCTRLTGAPSCQVILPQGRYTDGCLAVHPAKLPAHWRLVQVLYSGDLLEVQ